MLHNEVYWKNWEIIKLRDNKNRGILIKVSRKIEKKLNKNKSRNIVIFSGSHKMRSG